MPNFTPVAPQQERLPLASGAGAGQQPQDDGDADRGQATQRLDGLAVLVEVLLLGGDRGVDGSAAVADDQLEATSAPVRTAPTVNSRILVVSSVTKTVLKPSESNHSTSVHTLAASEPKKPRATRIAMVGPRGPRRRPNIVRPPPQRPPGRPAPADGVGRPSS